MKNKYILPLTATITLFLTGCFSDEGNYDYTEIIETTAPGIESSYNVVSLQDTLRIDPGLTPGDAFEYLWILGHLSPPHLDTIGRENVLDYPVKLKSGLYEIVLRATNLANGQPTYHRTSLSVVTPFSVGFYVLKDMGDHTDLDLHIPTDDEPLSNLLEKSDDGVMNGKPTSLGVTFDYSFNNPETNTNERAITLNICAGEEARIIRVDDMTTIYTNQEFFLGEVSTATPYYITHHGGGMVYVTSEGIFFNDLLMQGDGKFGIKRPVTMGKAGYVPNPRSLVAAPEIYFYDDLNHRFLGLEGSMGLIISGDDNVIPHELLYLGCNYAYRMMYQGYAIFQDRDVPGKRYLYQTMMASGVSFITGTAEINPSLKFNEATYFATNELDAFAIYFLHDNRLYMYDVNNGIEIPLAPQGFPAGEEITYVSNRYYQNPADAEANFNYLAIATHQAGRYKIYLYNIVGGQPYGNPVRILEGEGKVAKMQYFTNKFLTDPNAASVNNNYIPLSI
ncbi:MAG: hypothetical protein LBK12_04335 [Odoribacteraceae bacterium]|jgi:hypothetical protein|nr:hypothetical protein [Odoribacteraceae bacterium]